MWKPPEFNLPYTLLGYYKDVPIIADSQTLNPFPSYRKQIMNLIGAIERICTTALAITLLCIGIPPWEVIIVWYIIMCLCQESK